MGYFRWHQPVQFPTFGLPLREGAERLDVIVGRRLHCLYRLALLGQPAPLLRDRQVRFHVLPVLLRSFARGFGLLGTRRPAARTAAGLGRTPRTAHLLRLQLLARRGALSGRRLVLAPLPRLSLESLPAPCLLLGSIHRRCGAHANV